MRKLLQKILCLFGKHDHEEMGLVFENEVKNIGLKFLRCKACGSLGSEPTKLYRKPLVVEEK